MRPFLQRDFLARQHIFPCEEKLTVNANHFDGIGGSAV
jgi:hypothetical protein